MLNIIRNNRFKLFIVNLFYLLLFEQNGQAGQWVFYDANHKIGLYSVYFIDPQRGFAVTFLDKILFTKDGGKTWIENFKIDDSKKRQLKFFNVKMVELKDVFFVNQLYGWVVGDNHIILHTMDGGITWSYQESGLKPFTVQNPVTGQKVELPRELMGVFFITPQDGWAVGGFGTIIHTSDGGLTWKKQNKWVDEIYHDVFFIDQWTGWIVGDRGTILHTTNGGEGWFWGWKKQDSGTYARLMGVHFVDKKIGWAVGGKTVLHTADGGKTWKEQARFEKTKWLTDVYFVDRNIGWVVGDGPIQHTKDGGKTWIEQPISNPDQITRIRCLDAQHCWAAGTRGVFWYISDSGP